MLENRANPSRTVAEIDAGRQWTRAFVSFPLKSRMVNRDPMVNQNDPADTARDNRECRGQ